VTVRLYLDEDVATELARILRSLGYDAVSAHELDPTRLEDVDHVARATAQGRAVLTYNYRDFLRIAGDWFQAGRPHAGVIISYHQYSRDELGVLRQAVVSMLEAVSAEALENTVAFLDQYRGGGT
jgi:predicted nuclease of predicted toxin-antitoxin system